MSFNTEPKTLSMSYSDTTINPSEGWSSPFSISQCESDSLKSAGNSEDENEKNEIVIKSASTMDIMNAFNLPIAHHPETTKEMLASFRKQPNHDAKIIISSLPDANIQMSSQSSISLTEKLTKTRVPTDQIVSSTIPEREIVEEDHDLSKWSNAEEKDCDLKVMKSSIQIKHHEIVNRNDPCDILKAIITYSFIQSFMILKAKIKRSFQDA
ncbi:Uncharacterized protein BM_BM437 [Brugia malayi]|uniref:Bm437 n=1 Tax=Brugia malayi TaxID=6279 RepID=A0A4E9F9P1_BRUMA|nr:Uncharacterized protein BM_BM437 [Brugia malayi]VIO93575.1 Uncharacterized protein BM_BM437 [Brugia malayi]